MKKLWFLPVMACLVFLATALVMQQSASAYAIDPDGWMTATAQYEKDTCSWSYSWKFDYCPTQTPKPIQQVTQEFLEFCKSSPYQLQPGCPYEPTPITTQQPYPGPITDDCETTTYPGPDCGVFGDARIGDPLTPWPDPEPTPTALRWQISRPVDRRPRQ